MRTVTWTVIMLTWLLLSAGCGESSDSGNPSSEATGGQETHPDKGPHGGELIEIGDHLAHLEVVHDDDAGTITLYALGSGLKPTALTKAPVLSLPTSTGPKQMVATSRGGTKSEWVFSDPALKSEPEGARLRVVLNGVTYTPELPHDHAGHDD